jgi:hypothetical protein
MDPVPRPGCVDEDRDGYGVGCRRGVDCDDSDPSSTLGCVGVIWGEGGRPFDPADPDQEFDGVIVDDDGYLTLAGDGGGSNFVWVSNSREGTVSKLDARTGEEVARYPSVVPRPANGARPWNEPCDMERSGNCPSRTALDFRRDAWVANRAFANQGTVTKFANLEGDCIDVDGSGEIETSRDVNGDGRIDLASPAEFLGERDECVLFTVNVGEPGDIPRAMAIAPDESARLSIEGNVWVGLNRARTAVELSGVDGSTLRVVDLDINPYGALADKTLNVVWFTNAGWQASGENPPAVQNVDFITGEVSRRYEVDQPIAGCDEQVGTYGITVDELGRVWVAGFPCEGAFRLDPVSETWMAVPTPGHGGPRGLIADGAGHIWMAHSHCDGGGDCAVLSRFSIDPPWNVQRHELRPAGASGSIGVDIDRDGKVWVINQSSSSATRFDPATGAMDQFDVGNGPYTYSDFTGHGLFLQFPRGYFRAVSEACPGAIWNRLDVDGSIPDGSRVEVSVRTAETRDALRAARWIGTWTGSPAMLEEAPGPVPPGAFFEVQLFLISERAGVVPVVSRIAATYACPVL